jgi:hypothetical protein
MDESIFMIRIITPILISLFILALILWIGKGGSDMSDGLGWA